MGAGLLSPDSKRLGPGAPIASCGHEMAPRPEVTVDHCVRRKELLRLSRRLEALHLPLASPSGSMRILGSIVEEPACPMPYIRKDCPLTHAIAAQAVGDKAVRLACISVLAADA
jgi:hypothetical protein